MQYCQELSPLLVPQRNYHISSLLEVLVCDLQARKLCYPWERAGSHAARQAVVRGERNSFFLGAERWSLRIVLWKGYCGSAVGLPIQNSDEH